MVVTWTSGYNIDEATPFVEWGWADQCPKLAPAGTLTFSRSSMCGMMSVLSIKKNYKYIYF